MAKQVTLSVKDSLKKLQKSLDSIAPRVEKEINQAVKEIAMAAHASIIAKAQAELNKNRQDYLKGLEFYDLGDNNFVISLDGEFANKLEEGYGPFNMVPGLLKSEKLVQVGTRTGQKWVQDSKPQGKAQETHKFAHVPLERQPFSKAAKTADLASAIQAMTSSSVLGGPKQKITKIFKDPLGNPMQGRVAIGRSENPMVDGLVKYQKTYTSESGKQITQSVYINYRTVSEKGKPWIHPGFKGLKAFEEAEADIVKNIDLIIKTLL